MLKFDADAVLQPGVQNRTLQRFAHLNRSRTYRERSGQFAMEGYRLVLDAAESGVRLHTLILTESAACHYGDAFAPYLKGVQTLLIADGLAKTISDTETAQGVFAVAQMPREMQTLPQQVASGRKLYLQRFVEFDRSFPVEHKNSAGASLDRQAASGVSLTASGADKTEQQYKNS